MRKVVYEREGDAADLSRREVAEAYLTDDHVLLGVNAKATLGKVVFAGAIEDAKEGS